MIETTVGFPQTMYDEKFALTDMFSDEGKYGKDVTVGEDLSNDNHTKAINLLGVCYENSYGHTEIGASKEPVQAVCRNSMATEQENSDALTMLKVDSVIIDNPVLERIRGMWVAINPLFEQGGGLLVSDEDAPLYYVINVTKLVPCMYGLYGMTLNNYPIAQNYTELGNNTAYMAWSREQLRTIDADMKNTLISGARRFGTITGEELFNTSSFFGDIGNHMLTESMGALVGSLMTPTKTVRILECYIEMINDYELIAHMTTEELDFRGDEQPTSTRKEEDVLFTKWNPEEKGLKENPFFVHNKLKSIIVPYPYQRLYKYENSENFLEYKNRIKAIGKEKGIRIFNHMQIMKTFYANEQIIRQRGMPVLEEYHSERNTAVLGCQVEYLDTIAKRENKQFNNEGVYVWYVGECYPAFLFGLKKGDIISAVDGFEINTPDDLRNYVQALEPFTTIHLSVVRNKKKIEIPVELSYVLRSGTVYSEEEKNIIRKDVEKEIKSSTGLSTKMKKKLYDLSLENLI